MIDNLIRCIAAPGAAILLLSGCNGMFAGIYDEPLEVSDYGFVEKCKPGVPGEIYVDATSYTDWVYIDFASATVETRSVTEDAPANWDFAVHRYDAKTNGGAVMGTDVTDINALTSLPAGEFVPDEWTTETIVTDMSTMMDGYLSYVDSDYNPELSKWLDVDTSTMPPVYTLSGKVYVLRLADGSMAALRLANFMNDSAIKGYLTIKYSYPIEF